MLQVSRVQAQGRYGPIGSFSIVARATQAQSASILRPDSKASSGTRAANPKIVGSAEALAPIHTRKAPKVRRND